MAAAYLSPALAPVMEVTRDGTRSTSSSKSVDISSFPLREQRNINYMACTLCPGDITSLEEMGRMFVTTTSTDLYRVGEHPNALASACAAGIPSYKSVPQGG